VQAEELRAASSSTSSNDVANPAALVAKSSSPGGLLQRLLNVGKSKIPSAVKEDPFGEIRVSYGGLVHDMNNVTTSVHSAASII
jgi:hypothetical protein